VALSGHQLATILRCPICGAEFGDVDVEFRCAEGHQFPVTEGVPRLVGRLEGSSQSIEESFGREWSYFRHGIDRSWGQPVELRVTKFLKHVGLSADELRGRLVLDAGCGNGTLSEAVANLGCEVVASDLSNSVILANRYFSTHDGRVRFLQADLQRHPFRPGTFDVVYCAGVLHHTPSTKETFERVAETVAPGGRLFVWLYWRVPGTKSRVRLGVRGVVARLPMRLKHAVAVAFGAEKALRFRITRKRELTWQEVMIGAHDFYTPRYRWEHTPEEVTAWYAELGFSDVELTESQRDGFGMLGIRATP
jgi:2-polyprenyl-3-methyl-5-hydroxy-6-metoxy-1,4-benzoquinol methylase